MRSSTSEVPDSWVADRFGQSSDFTLSVEPKEIVEVRCSVGANDGRHAFAEVASEACGEDYHIGIDFCAVLEAQAGFCV